MGISLRKEHSEMQTEPQGSEIKILKFILKYILILYHKG